MADKNIITKIKITLSVKEITKNGNRYRYYYCCCNPEEGGPYEQIILHLIKNHHFTLQQAEVLVQLTQRGRMAEMDNWENWK
jgi:hypothetical protein